MIALRLAQSKLAAQVVMTSAYITRHGGAFRAVSTAFALCVSAALLHATITLALPKWDNRQIDARSGAALDASQFEPASKSLTQQHVIENGSKSHKSHFGYGNLIEENVEKENGSVEICFSKACVNAAADILRNMDETADPCEDFYQFACGSFVKNTVMPDDDSRVNSFTTLSNKLKEQLRILLEEGGKKEEIAPFVQVKTFYRTCMDEETLAKRGVEPLKKILRELGGWPVVDGAKWEDGMFSWTRAVYKLRQLGFSNDWFFDFSVAEDWKNTTNRLFKVDQPELGLDKKYFTKGIQDPDVAAYHKFQVDVAMLLGASPERARKEMKEALIFEMALANYSLPKEERRNVSRLYNKMTIEDLQTRWPGIPWLEYVNQLLAPFHKVNIYAPAIVVVPSYLNEFEKLILSSPKRTIANYLLWRVAAASVPYLSEEARKLELALQTQLTGRTEFEPRWRECVAEIFKRRGESSDAASSSFTIPMSSMYVRRYFDDAAKATALEMVQDILDEFSSMLNELDWMDEATKNRAKEKSKKFVPHIGFPVELSDDAKLVELFSGLTMDPDSYYQNALKLARFAANFTFHALGEPVNKTSWTNHGYSAVVNAFYHPLENSIQFPAAILQGIFFGPARPRYLNYGAIGFIIGHEITHGFDDQGRQFDGDGNLVDWWDPETSRRFKEKAQCIIWQYGNYSVPDTGLKLNGITTQGENIADNGGLQEAYKAYERYVSRNGVEPRLPGLQGFTPQQHFWLSLANVNCALYRPEAARKQILTGVHSINRFRLNGPLSNTEEFSKDFKCEPKSAMNPELKCSLW